MLRFRILLLGAALLSGCVENKPYRLHNIADEFYPAQKDYFDEQPVPGGRTYRISFVEFDEKGDFWDRRQLGNAANRIGRAKKPVLLVTYIHGWHHNANDRKPGDNGDVETFRALLSELALSESTRDLQVHGVYLGWRGRLVQGPLDYLTFLDRKGAATRVAGTPVTETIFELIRQARKYHPGQSKCVVIGHSFGALVLEKAMAQALTGGVLVQDVESEGGAFNAPADLILLVNSAGESIYAKEMSEMFARIGHRDVLDANRPLLVQITSESDTATSGWFPFGTFLPNLFAHRKYHWDDKYGTLSQEVDQHEYLTKTPGHNARLFTHKIRQTTGPSQGPSRTTVATMAMRQSETDSTPPQKENPAFEENLQHPQGLLFATGSKEDPNRFQWWEISRFKSNHPTPYWIMHVPKQIIHGHSPIFTPAGRAMMAALFRIANRKDEPGPRQMMLRPQGPR